MNESPAWACRGESTSWCRGAPSPCRDSITFLLASSFASFWSALWTLYTQPPPVWLSRRSVYPLLHCFSYCSRIPLQRSQGLIKALLSWGLSWSRCFRTSPSCFLPLGRGWRCYLAPRLPSASLIALLNHVLSTAYQQGRSSAYYWRKSQFSWDLKQKYS